MPNLIPKSLLFVHMDWARPAGRLILASVALLIGLVIVAVLMRRPKPDRPATWAECMAGAVGVFAMMTLAYAIIPSEWINFSDKYLQWDTTKFVFQSHQKIFGLGVNWPFNFDKRSVRDIIVVVIYGVFFGANLYLFSKWQKRGVEQAEVAEKPRTSRFGRPLRRRATEPITVGASTNGGES
jgi:hypothetical protein